MLASDLVRLVERARLASVTEDEMQRAFADALTAQGWDFEREVRFTPRDRIDFMVGTVGVELKVDGSTAAVLRQLRRYAESGFCSELVLVSTCAAHAALQQQQLAVPLTVVRPAPWM